MVTAQGEEGPNLFNQQKTIAVAVSEQEGAQNVAKFEYLLGELGLSGSLEKVPVKMPRLKALADQLLITALQNNRDGVATLVILYASGESVKIGDMHELLVNKNKMKSFPIQKVFDGLSKVPNTFVIALFDFKPAVLGEVPLEQVPVNHVIWMDGHKSQRNSVITVTPIDSMMCLIDEYTRHLKSITAADGTVRLPRDIKGLKAEHFIKTKCQVQLKFVNHRPAAVASSAAMSDMHMEDATGADVPLERQIQILMNMYLKYKNPALLVQIEQLEMQLGGTPTQGLDQPYQRVESMPNQPQSQTRKHKSKSSSSSSSSSSSCSHCSDCNADEPDNMDVDPASIIKTQAAAGDNSGIVEIKYPNGQVYKGQVLNGKRHGHGVLTWPNGDKYDGEFVNNQIQGYGTKVHRNTDKYTGYFVAGKRQGKGNLHMRNNNKYEGDFMENKMHGSGVYIWNNGNKYVGAFVDNQMQGAGVFTNHKGDRYEGSFMAGKKHGAGVLTPHGKAAQPGTWVDGKRV